MTAVLTARRDLALVARSVGAGLPDAVPLRDAALAELAGAGTPLEVAMAVTDLLSLATEAEVHHLEVGDVAAAFAEADRAGRLREICALRLGFRAL